MMTSPTATSRSERGLTFLELVFTVAIVSVISAIFIPSLRNFFAANQLRNEAYHVVTLMRYLQSKAVGEVKEYRVYVDLDAQEYWGARVDITESEEGEEGEESAPVTIVVPLERLGGRHALPQGVTIRDADTADEGVDYIALFGDGTAKGKGMHMQNERDAVFTISLNQATGVAKVYNADHSLN